MTTPSAAAGEPLPLPCPFCGEHLERAPAKAWRHERGDPDSDSPPCIMSKHGIPDEQLAAWNSRAPEPAPLPSGIEPIDTAPKDGTEFMCFAPAYDGLSPLLMPCSWHPDAGFCIDELREATHWFPGVQVPQRPEPAPLPSGVIATGKDRLPNFNPMLGDDAECPAEPDEAAVRDAPARYTTPGRMSVASVGDLRDAGGPVQVDDADWAWVCGEVDWLTAAVCAIRDALTLAPPASPAADCVGKSVQEEDKFSLEIPASPAPTVVTRFLDGTLEPVIAGGRARKEPSS